MATRHPWGPALDRLARRLGPVLRRLAGRPSEAHLAALARRHRPAPAGRGQQRPVELEDGRRAFARGHFGEALHVFSSLVARDPDDAWAWHGRGDALQLLGAPAHALQAYERAVALDPDTGLHHGGRANALDALGRHDEAAVAWTLALRLDPSLAWMRAPRSTASG